jgi:hypothetical protein
MTSLLNAVPRNFLGVPALHRGVTAFAHPVSEMQAYPVHQKSLEVPLVERNVVEGHLFPEWRVIQFRLSTSF